MMPASAASPASLADAVLAGELAALARAITLAESRRADHREQAQALIQTLLPQTGEAIRVGITGVPGVGKSTMIDALGSHLTGRGEAAPRPRIEGTRADAGRGGREGRTCGLRRRRGDRASVGIVRV